MRNATLNHFTSAIPKSSWKIFHSVSLMENCYNISLLDHWIRKIVESLAPTF
jgi:hypothetical protein